MTELIVATMTAVAGFLTTRGWPTLGRRIRDHTALLKDMPPDTGEELKALLRAEVTELVRRDRRRLDSRVDRLLQARRAAFGVLGAVVGVAVVAGVSAALNAPASAQPSPNWVFTAIVVAPVVAVVLSAVAAMAVIRMDRLARQAVEQPERSGTSES